MNYEDYSRLFLSYGWEVTYGDKQDLVFMQQGGAELCGDGRFPAGNIDRTWLLGPQLFGGTLGQANLLALQNRVDTDLSHLDQAISNTRGEGFIPGVHDIHEVDVHCGEQVVVRQGGVYTYQNFSAEEGKQRVLSAGGVHIELADQHAENDLRWNLIPGMTGIPNARDQHFHTDVPRLEWFGISPEVLVAAAVGTIVQLNSPVRKVVIYSRD